MGLGLTILILTGIAAIFGLFIWLIILYFAKEEIEVEDNFILNFMSNFAVPKKGYCIGIEKSCSKINNRYLIEYLPTDLNKKELSEGIIEPVRVSVDKNHIVVLPKGHPSKNKNLKIILAPRAEDYDDDFKLTFFGKILMNMTEAINAVNVETATVREGSERKTKILLNEGDGEISLNHIEKTDELMKQFTKMLVDNTSKPSSQRPVGGFTQV